MATRAAVYKSTSNGINSDGSLMNVGNRLGDRPSIKLFPQYNSGDTMRALLADCGGLGDEAVPFPSDSSWASRRPAAIDENLHQQGQRQRQQRQPEQRGVHEHQREQQQQRRRQQQPQQQEQQVIPHYNTIKYQPATDQFRSTFQLGSGPSSPVPSNGGSARWAAPSSLSASSSSSSSSSSAGHPVAMSAHEAQRLLWEAARQGNTQLVRQALAAGADATVPNPTDGWIALHYAASADRRLTCQVLLSLPSAAQQCIARSVAGQTPVALCRSAAIGEMMRNAGRL
jgi:hypothetical protein